MQHTKCSFLALAFMLFGQRSAAQPACGFLDSTGSSFSSSVRSFQIWKNEDTLNYVFNLKLISSPHTLNLFQYTIEGDPIDPINYEMPNGHILSRNGTYFGSTLLDTNIFLIKRYSLDGDSIWSGILDLTTLPMPVITMYNLDELGNCYVSGYNAQGGFRSFVAKMDTSGATIWIKRYDTGHDHATLRVVTVVPGKLLLVNRNSIETHIRQISPTTGDIFWTSKSIYIPTTTENWIAPFGDNGFVYTIRRQSGPSGPGGYCGVVILDSLGKMVSMKNGHEFIPNPWYINGITGVYRLLNGNYLFQVAGQTLSGNQRFTIYTDSLFNTLCMRTDLAEIVALYNIDTMKAAIITDWPTTVGVIPTTCDVDCFSVVSNTAELPNNQPQATLQPNPAIANTFLQIDPVWVGCTVHLYNLQGQLLQTWIPSTAPHEMNLEGIPSGTYYVRLLHPRYAPCVLPLVIHP
ncbi:MAG: hypothetical protein RIR11_1381 [Bacteroidota bacterium]